MLNHLISELHRRSDLSDDQADEAVAILVGESAAVEEKADFLMALANKGETPAEMASFARALRQRAIPVPLDSATRQREILDVCGTGGDRQNTINISTTVALLVAAAGVTVAKHGNRAITSLAGSADVLEELGIPFDLTPEQAAADLRDHGFAFFFAPRFHPAFKHIAPARKLCAARGQRTLFNFLGPLLNPAHPTAQLVGVPQPELCAPMAHVLQSLGVRRGMVVSGRAGQASLDELSTLGENTIAEFYHDHGFACSVTTFSELPIQVGSLSDLAGGDRAANARVVRAILSGQERGPKRDAVLLNSGAALMVANSARSIATGWAMASALIDSGQALAKLEALISSRT